MADADDVRRLALALPHVEEIDSDGFDFRVGGKGFVWSYPERTPGKPRVIRSDVAVLYVGDEAVRARQDAEAAHGEEDRRVAALQRAAADRREGLARLHGQVNALKSRAAAAEDELGRLTTAREEAAARAERAQRDFTALETR